MVVIYAFNPKTKEAEAEAGNLCESEAILVYKMSFRTTRIVAQRKSVQKYTYTFFFL